MHAFKPDIVLASQFGDLVFAAPAGRLCGSLVLGGVRSDGFYELRSLGWRARAVLPLTDGLIANSYRAKENLMSEGIAASKIEVVPNVIDVDAFDESAAIGPSEALPAGRIAVTCVGSLHRCKRYDRFLEALGLACAAEPAVLGVIAGKDLGAGAALHDKAVSLGLLPGKLKFLGECGRIPALLRSSRMLVLCSEYEGFPNVILEAMAARLPVVSTPAGDAGRIVQEGTTGYIVEPDDPAMLAERILRLARDLPLSQRLGGAGRKLVEEKYTLSRLPKRLVSVFQHFAGRDGRRGMREQLESADGGQRFSVAGAPVRRATR
jgi:glycosyltransferase involved in cell wall biosynthesis